MQLLKISPTMTGVFSLKPASNIAIRAGPAYDLNNGGGRKRASVGGKRK